VTKMGGRRCCWVLRYMYLHTYNKVYRYTYTLSIPPTGRVGKRSRMHGKAYIAFRLPDHG
jgi:hypothetical protein